MRNQFKEIKKGIEEINVTKKHLQSRLKKAKKDEVLSLGTKNDLLKMARNQVKLAIKIQKEDAELLAKLSRPKSLLDKIKDLLANLL